MSFLDRLRGNKNKTEEKTQTKAEPKVKSESEKHDDFVRRLREQTPVSYTHLTLPTNSLV